MQAKRGLNALLAGSLCSLLLLLGAGCEKEKGLRITEIEPETGPFTGGERVVIHGSGFQAGGAMGVKVYFGSKNAKVLGFKGDSKLMVEAPAGELGETVDIQIIFDDAREKTLEQAYTYIDPGKGFGVEALTEGEEAVEVKDK